MRLNELLALPKQCVFIVLDKEGGKALVNYTRSMGVVLSGLYAEFSGRATNLELKVVSAGADIETLKLHTEYYRQYYHTRLGYGELRPVGRKVVEYKVRAVPSVRFKGVLVELVSSRGEVKVVGKFKNMGEAKTFIETCYGEGNPFKLLVHALNADTKAFLLEEQTKLLELR